MENSIGSAISNILKNQLKVIIKPNPMEKGFGLNFIIFFCCFLMQLSCMFSGVYAIYFDTCI